ncbi:hypothetical protein [Bradyrhizobium sp. NBAIM01]|uniref:hypothetical protein n=1 Tax=Bradyrhizobium sp. NBAIM01 TaxID=2793818 RepID=UPI001CD679A0|nr:hypothetical protein [Bradyrhizobium sp. NBAIM01]MCA1513640.1 hypothetical protein [Bradyrhizobium sp. NBAIM01]
MKFQLLGDFPCKGGAMVIPVGTMIEYAPGEAAARVVASPWEAGGQFNGTPVPIPLPLNAKALDQAAYDQMVAWYTPISDQLLRQLQYTPGIQPRT